MSRRGEWRALDLAGLAFLLTVAGCSTPPRFGPDPPFDLAAFSGQDAEAPPARSPVAAPPRPPNPEEPMRVRVDAFCSSLRYDLFENEIIDISGHKIGIEKLKDTEIRRAGVRGTFGSFVRGYVQAFGEQSFDDTYRGVGLGAGASGFPVLARLGENLDLIMFIDGATNVVFGTGEVPVYDRYGTPVDELDHYLVYLNTELTVGLGLDLYGIKPSLGVAYASHLGTIAAEDEIQGASIDIEGTITAFNFGGYAGVAYRSRDVPVYAEARYYFGLIEGFFLAAGFTF
jgi:hypothetical protein